MKKIEITGVVLLVILGLILRFIALKNFGTMWHDELYSWFFASQNTFLDTIKECTKQDIHMPLYFVLLHFWIKLFSQNVDTMRILSFILSCTLLPLGYFVTKKIFNKTTAFFCLIFLSINTFCIYYSLEIRQYCIVLPLSLLCVYSYYLLCQKFSKKRAIFYILSWATMFYTFTVAPLFWFVHFIFGLFFSNEKKSFLFVNTILILISGLAVFWTYSSAFSLYNNFSFYPLDIFKFRPFWIWDMFENFYTHENMQIYATNYYMTGNLKELIPQKRYFCVVFLPIVISMFTLIKGFFSKNKNFYMVFLPSFIFTVTLILLAIFNLAVFQTRYLTIVFPVFMIALSFGFSSFKNKILCFLLFFSLISINIYNTIVSSNSVLRLHRKLTYNISNTLNYINLNDNDIILSPYMGNKLSYFASRGLFIPFSIDGVFVLKDKFSRNFYLGNMSNKLNRSNIREYLIDDYVNDIANKEFEKNLYNNYIKPMEKGQKLILINLVPDYTKSAKELNITKDNYKNYDFTGFLFSKAGHDALLILNKYLKHETRYITPDGYSFWVFRKN